MQRSCDQISVGSFMDWTTNGSRYFRTFVQALCFSRQVVRYQMLLRYSSDSWPHRALKTLATLFGKSAICGEFFAFYGEANQKITTHIIDVSLQEGSRRIYVAEGEGNAIK